ncbi:hypothetical protein P8452_54226 [Trifolium repens]|nr:hypothetical protein P8452_54226 [Trifolium repens]
MPKYIAGAEPKMDTSDWRGQLQPEQRQRIVNKIMDILERHLPVSGQEGLHELREIAQRFEEKMFTTATSQYDYLRKISIKMLALENRHQGTMANYIAPNQVGPNNKPPDPDEMAPKMKRSKLAELVSEGEKSGIIPSILKDWRNDKHASSPILEEKRKRDAAVGTSRQVPGVVTHDRKLTASFFVPNVSANVTTSIPAHNSSGVGVCAASSPYLLYALCGIRHLEESTYNREYLLEMARKDKEELQKTLDDLGDAEQEIRDLRSEIERLKMAKSTDDKTRKKLEKVLEAEMKSLIEANKTIADARTQVKVLESEVEKLKTDKASLQEEVVNLKKTNTNLEAANHEYQVKAAVDFAAGFAEAIAQVQVLAPEVDISEAQYTKEIRDGQLVIASDEDEGGDEEDSGKKLVDVQNDQIHAVMKSGVKPV